MSFRNSMKPKTIARSSTFSAGLWIAYLVLESVVGVGSTHALMLVLIGVLAWFVLFLVWALPAPEEPRWKTYLRVVAVICVTLGLGGAFPARLGDGRLGRTRRILRRCGHRNGLGKSTDQAYRLSPASTAREYGVAIIALAFSGAAALSHG